MDHVTVQHLQDHFVNFAKNDNLGQISTWLLAQADLKGAACSACETLAQLHSMAVDFPKTGRPAVIRAEQLQELVSEHGQAMACFKATATYSPGYAEATVHNLVSP